MQQKSTSPSNGHSFLKFPELTMPTVKSKAASGARQSSGTTRFKDLSKDKLRGGYYTSQPIADWICQWAIRSQHDCVLEPSSGGGAFLRASTSRLLDLKATPHAIGKQLVGVEFIEEEAVCAADSLIPFVGKTASTIVHQGDFFAWRESNEGLAFDAVVGNPPFIRYQSFPEPHRTLAMTLMKSEGLTPNKLTNIWVPFVVAATSMLKVGGRLGMVLPAELLQVTYASQLRSRLTDQFKRLDIVACNELFFEKAEQEVVILLAEGKLKAPLASNNCRVSMTETASASEVLSSNARQVVAKSQPKVVQHESEKWLKYFLDGTEIDFMRALRASDAACSLATYAEVDVGVVTGRNEFFVISDEQVEDFGLENFVSPVISRSAHLDGASVSRKDWRNMAKAGDRVHLLDLKDVPDFKISKELREYLANGEAREVHKGYKCSIRRPWYAVPSVWAPDAFMFRQIYDFPRVVLNQAKASSTDTIHRMSIKKGDSRDVVAGMYTWLTAASAEIEGRSYGGGVLELEPTEAERLLVPSKLASGLNFQECDELIRLGRLDEVLERNAKSILIDSMGLSKSEAMALRNIWMKMRNRRRARKKSARNTVK